MVTTVTYDEVDRLFYERLRLAAVAAGLAVDVNLYSGNPSGYQTARDALKATLTPLKKRLVEVFGVGSWDDRGEITDSRIVVNRLGERPGSLGGSPVAYYEAYKDNSGADKFKKYRYPDMSSDLDYEVRIITKSILMERIMSTIVGNAIGRGRYTQTVDDSGQFTPNYVMVVSNGGFNLSGQSFIERGFRYTVEDVFLQDPELIADNIAPINTVQFSLYLPDSQTPVVNEIDSLNLNYRLPFSLPFNLP